MVRKYERGAKKGLRTYDLLVNGISRILYEENKELKNALVYLHDIRNADHTSTGGPGSLSRAVELPQPTVKLAFRLDVIVHKRVAAGVVEPVVEATATAVQDVKVGQTGRGVEKVVVKVAEPVEATDAVEDAGVVETVKVVQPPVPTVVQEGVEKYLLLDFVVKKVVVKVAEPVEATDAVEDAKVVQPPVATVVQEGAEDCLLLDFVVKVAEPPVAAVVQESADHCSLLEVVVKVGENVAAVVESQTTKAVETQPTNAVEPRTPNRIHQIVVVLETAQPVKVAEAAEAAETATANVSLTLCLAAEDVLDLNRVEALGEALGEDVVAASVEGPEALAVKVDVKGIDVETASLTCQLKVVKGALVETQAVVARTKVGVVKGVEAANPVGGGEIVVANDAADDIVVVKAVELCGHVATQNVIKDVSVTDPVEGVLTGVWEGKEVGVEPGRHAWMLWWKQNGMSCGKMKA
ncbi:hypothetical protein HK104_008967 [Borealophlyctis nickersoniae]|nr:hypothetical protein HK104_008967 [Borealophlyctis nickersoniae]